MSYYNQTNQYSGVIFNAEHEAQGQEIKIVNQVISATVFGLEEAEIVNILYTNIAANVDNKLKKEFGNILDDNLPAINNFIKEKVLLSLSTSESLQTSKDVALTTESLGVIPIDNQLLYTKVISIINSTFEKYGIVTKYKGGQYVMVPTVTEVVDIVENGQTKTVLASEYPNLPSRTLRPPQLFVEENGVRVNLFETELFQSLKLAYEMTEIFKRLNRNNLNQTSYEFQELLNLVPEKYKSYFTKIQSLEEAQKLHKSLKVSAQLEIRRLQNSKSIEIIDGECILPPMFAEEYGIKQGMNMSDINEDFFKEQIRNENLENTYLQVYDGIIKDLKKSISNLVTEVFISNGNKDVVLGPAKFSFYPIDNTSLRSNVNKDTATELGTSIWLLLDTDSEGIIKFNTFIDTYNLRNSENYKRIMYYIEALNFVSNKKLSRELIIQYINSISSNETNLKQSQSLTLTDAERIEMRKYLNKMFVSYHTMNETYLSHIVKNIMPNEDGTKNLPSYITEGLFSTNNAKPELLVDVLAKHKLEAFNMSIKVMSARIPGQSFQSFMNLKIVGFDYFKNPKTGAYTNNIQVPIEVLWFQGANYEIDKENLMQYNVNKKGFIEPFYYNTDFSNIENSFRNLIHAIKTGDGFNNVSVDKNLFNKYLLKRENIKGLQNAVTFTLLEVTRSPKNIFKAQTAMDMSPLDVYIAEGERLVKEKLTQKYKTYLQSNAAAVKAYMFNKYQELLKQVGNSDLELGTYTINNLDEIFIKDLVKLEYAIIIDSEKLLTVTDPSSVASSQINNVIGKEVIGIMATTLKAYSMLLTHFYNVIKKGDVNDYLDFNLTIEGETYYLANVPIFKILKENNVGYSKYEEYNDKLQRIIFKYEELLKTYDEEVLGLTNISVEERRKKLTEEIAHLIENETDQTLSQLLSAATDNAKELKLGKMNIDTNLAGVAATIVLFTGDLNKAVKITNSPLMRKFIKDCDKNFMFGYNPLNPFQKFILERNVRELNLPELIDIEYEVSNSSLSQEIKRKVIGIINNIRENMLLYNSNNNSDIIKAEIYFETTLNKSLEELEILFYNSTSEDFNENNAKWYAKSLGKLRLFTYLSYMNKSIGSSLTLDTFRDDLLEMFKMANIVRNVGKLGSLTQGNPNDTQSQVYFGKAFYDMISEDLGRSIQDLFFECPIYIEENKLIVVPTEKNTDKEILSMIENQTPSAKGLFEAIVKDIKLGDLYEALLISNGKEPKTLIYNKLLDNNPHFKSKLKTYAASVLSAYKTSFTHRLIWDLSSKILAYDMADIIDDDFVKKLGNLSDRLLSESVFKASKENGKDLHIVTLNNTTYDLTDPEDVLEFRALFEDPETLNKLFKRYKFYDNLAIQTNKIYENGKQTTKKMLSLKQNFIGLNDNALLLNMNTIKAEFKELSNNLKKALFLYNVIVYQNRRKKGALTEVMGISEFDNDNNYLKQYNLDYTHIANSIKLEVDTNYLMRGLLLEGFGKEMTERKAKQEALKNKGRSMFFILANYDNGYKKTSLTEWQIGKDGSIKKLLVVETDKLRLSSTARIERVNTYQKQMTSIDFLNNFKDCYK
jgi:hypothetical protein